MKWIIVTSQDIGPAFGKCWHTHYHTLHSPYILLNKEDNDLISWFGKKLQNPQPPILKSYLQTQPMVAWNFSPKPVACHVLRYQSLILERYGLYPRGAPRGLGRDHIQQSEAHISRTPSPDKPPERLGSHPLASPHLLPGTLAAPQSPFFKQMHELSQRDEEPQFQRSARRRRRISCRRKRVSSPHWESLNQKLVELQTTH